MIKDYQNLIDRYLRQEMADEEKKQFEHRLARDKGLRREYELTRIIAEEVGKISLREQMNQWDKEMDEERRIADKKSVRRRVIAIMLSAAVVLFIGGVLIQRYFVTENDNMGKVTTKTAPLGSLHAEEMNQIAEAGNGGKVNTGTAQSKEVQNMNYDTTHESKGIIFKEEVAGITHKDMKKVAAPSVMENISAEGDNNTSSEPTETDAVRSREKVSNRDRYLAELYKDYKDDFLEFYRDSAVGNKNWAEFLKDPSNKRWELARMFLDKRLSDKSSSKGNRLVVRKKTDPINISKTQQDKKR